VSQASFDKRFLKLAHKASWKNREAILSSGKCSCFQCLGSFEKGDVKEWIDSSSTARCPLCGCDTVIGDKSGLPIENKTFLSEMKSTWFGVR
jgi:hypothetical protein